MTLFFYFDPFDMRVRWGERFYRFVPYPESNDMCQCVIIVICLVYSGRRAKKSTPLLAIYTPCGGERWRIKRL